jgi:hypothetical protein
MLAVSHIHQNPADFHILKISLIMFISPSTKFTPLTTYEPAVTNFEAIHPADVIAAIDPAATMAPTEAKYIKFPAMPNQHLRDS